MRRLLTIRSLVKYAVLLALMLAIGLGVSSSWGQLTGGSQFPPPPPDSSAPSITIIWPVEDVTLSGLVNVQTKSSDDWGVVAVDFHVDGALVYTTETSPFGMSWDTTLLADGVHTLQATAYDAAGKFGSSPLITLTVANKPGLRKGSGKPKGQSTLRK